MSAVDEFTTTEGASWAAGRLDIDTDGRMWLYQYKIRKGLRSHMAEARGGGKPSPVDLDLVRAKTGERFRLCGVQYQGHTKGCVRLTFQGFARLPA